MSLPLRTSADALAMSSDSREERKYPVPNSRVSLLTAWLDARLPRDPQYPTGVITSCYFDSEGLDAYRESADGEFSKLKLRLRWYGDPVDPYSGVWMEIKSRSGTLSEKQRVRFSSEGAPNQYGLIMPDRQELVRRLGEVERSGAETASMVPTLKPSALIRYQRIRWQARDRSVRVSLDSDVRAAHPSGAPIWLPIEDGAVLEIKSAGELPVQLAHLRQLGLRRAAHSKYALAIETLYGSGL